MVPFCPLISPSVNNKVLIDIYLPKSSARDRMWHKVSFFVQDKGGFGSEFPFSTGCRTMAKEMTLPYYFLISLKRTDKIMLFPKGTNRKRNAKYHVLDQFHYPTTITVTVCSTLNISKQKANVYCWLLLPGEELKPVPQLVLVWFIMVLIARSTVILILQVAIRVDTVEICPVAYHYL